MVDTRPLSIEELSKLHIFRSSYRSVHQLSFVRAGQPPELTWALQAVDLKRPVTRRLDGESVEDLSELYGPQDSLRFIGAFAPTTESSEDSELIGLLTWRYDAWNESVWLCDIRVKAEHRGHGVGSRLMEDLMWAAMREGARGIMLETQNTNVSAIDFYLQRGFKLTGFNEAMYGEPGVADAALYFWYSFGG